MRLNRGTHNNSTRARKFWTCGYDDSVPMVGIVHTLFPDEEYGGDLTNASLAKEDDVLVYDYGPCPVETPEDSFNGRILWFDGECGRQRRDREQDIYFGPLSQLHLENASDIFWPYLLTEVITLNATAQLLAKRSTNGQAGDGFLVYAQSHCVHYRQAAFDAISTMSIQRGLPLPTAIGPCKGTLRAKQPALKTTKRDPEKLRGYRFALVMENQRQPGYVTEKILHAYLADCIPIYYGDRDTVDTMFTPESYIWYDINDPGPALDRIAHLETNRTAFYEMRAIPILARGAARRWLSLTDDVDGGEFKRHIVQVVTPKHALTQVQGSQSHLTFLALLTFFGLAWTLKHRMWLWRGRPLTFGRKII